MIHKRLLSAAARNIDLGSLAIRVPRVSDCDEESRDVDVVDDESTRYSSTAGKSSRFWARQSAAYFQAKSACVISTCETTSTGNDTTITRGKRYVRKGYWGSVGIQSHRRYNNECSETFSNKKPS